MVKTTDQEYRDLAKTQYGSDDIEIDIDAKVAVGDDKDGAAGAWVQAWVWIDEPEVSDGSE